MKQSELTDWTETDKLERACLYEYYYHKTAGTRHLRNFMIVFITLVFLSGISVIYGYSYILIEKHISFEYLVCIFLIYAFILLILLRMRKHEKGMLSDIQAGNVRYKECIVKEVLKTYKGLVLVKACTADGTEIEEPYEVMTKKPVVSGDTVILYKLYAYNEYELVTEEYIKGLCRVKSIRMEEIKDVE